MRSHAKRYVNPTSLESSVWKKLKRDWLSMSKNCAFAESVFWSEDLQWWKWDSSYFSVEHVSMKTWSWEAGNWFETFGLIVNFPHFVVYTMLSSFGFREFRILTFFLLLSIRPGASCLILYWVVGLLSWYTRFDHRISPPDVRMTTVVKFRYT